jgi:ActR/RegA family two-component response regulator
MTHTPASLLIVDSDYECARMLAAQAEARGYRARTAPAVADVTTLLALEPFDAVLVDLDHAADTGLDLLAQLRRVSTDIEVLVMSDRTSMAATIQWFDPDAFACLRKSDVVPLFAAVARALERRQITAQNRRLVWELQTINDIASGVARSLELDEVLTGAVQRLVGAMQAAVGVIRLRNGQTAEFDIVAAAVPKGPQELARDLSAELTLPSDSVIATGRNVRVEDSAVLSHPARAARLLRSAISVPLLAGDEVLGTLSLGAFTPSRFDTADERLLSTIAGQIVVAIQNARLHQTVRNGKHEWEQIFDVMSDLVAVFDSRSELLMGNRALAEHLSLPITALRGTSCRDVGFCAGGDACDCGAGRQVASRTARREVTHRGGRRASGQECDGGNPWCAPARAHDERAGRRESPAHCGNGSVESGAVATRPVREAVGHRSARGGCRPRVEQSAHERDRLRAARRRGAAGRPGLTPFGGDCR